MKWIALLAVLLTAPTAFGQFCRTFGSRTAVGVSVPCYPTQTYYPTQTNYPTHHETHEERHIDYDTVTIPRAIKYRVNREYYTDNYSYLSESDRIVLTSKMTALETVNMLLERGQGKRSQYAPPEREGDYPAVAPLRQQARTDFEQERPATRTAPPPGAGRTTPDPKAGGVAPWTMKGPGDVHPELRSLMAKRCASCHQDDMPGKISSLADANLGKLTAEEWKDCLIAASTGEMPKPKKGQPPPEQVPEDELDYFLYQIRAMPKTAKTGAKIPPAADKKG